MIYIHELSFCMWSVDNTYHDSCIGDVQMHNGGNNLTHTRNAPRPFDQFLMSPLESFVQDIIFLFRNAQEFCHPKVMLLKQAQTEAARSKHQEFIFSQVSWKCCSICKIFSLLNQMHHTIQIKVCHVFCDFPNKVWLANSFFPAVLISSQNCLLFFGCVFCRSFVIDIMITLVHNQYIDSSDRDCRRARLIVQGEVQMNLGWYL